MARARNIKPGFFKNEVIGELPCETRLLFIGLWTLADREGRLEDRPKRINMELFPYDSFDVDSMLSRLQSDGFLMRYQVDNVRYIQLINFVKHQDPHYKEKASEIPPPDGIENIIKAVTVTRGQRARILERDNYVCQKCEATDNLCIDHIIPVSRGGDSSDENLQILCSKCNTEKGNKLAGETKGLKKSPHNQGAVIVRPDVDPMLIQSNRSMPSDSLIPDSLIPDSLDTDKSESSKKTRPIGKPPKGKIVPLGIQAIHATCSLYPPKAIWDDLQELVGDTPDSQKLSECFKSWVSKGFKPTNYAWVTDFYAKGIPTYGKQMAKDQPLDIDHPDYKMEAPPMSFSDQMLFRMRKITDPTLWHYNLWKKPFLEKHPEREYEVSEYERSMEYREIADRTITDEFGEPLAPVRGENEQVGNQVSVSR